MSKSSPGDLFLAAGDRYHGALLLLIVSITDTCHYFYVGPHHMPSPSPKLRSGPWTKSFADVIDTLQKLS
jgi:hypothetical protein